MYFWEEGDKFFPANSVFIYFRLAMRLHLSFMKLNDMLPDKKKKSKNFI